MEPFVWKEQHNQPPVFCLESWEKLQSDLSVGFTSRKGGVSKGVYESLNCGLHVQDIRRDVIANRKLAADVAGFALSEWTCGQQVHSSNIAVVDANDKGKGSISLDDAIPGVDALITSTPGVLLTSMYADCVPLYFLEPTTCVVGLAHAGWKGTVGKIALRTVEAMSEQFGCKPERIHAAIGPSIGPCCYEVDEHVAHQVLQVYPENASAAVRTDFPAGVNPQGERKYKLDLKEINRQFMIKAGINPVHIESSNWCTGCRTDLFYSYRKEHGATGRMMSWIGLR